MSDPEETNVPVRPTQPPADGTGVPDPPEIPSGGLTIPDPEPES